MTSHLSTRSSREAEGCVLFCEFLFYWVLHMTAPHIIDAERTIYMGTLNARTFRRCFFSEVVQVPSCWGLWTGRVRPVTPRAINFPINKGQSQIRTAMNS